MVWYTRVRIYKVRVGQIILGKVRVGQIILGKVRVGQILLGKVRVGLNPSVSVQFSIAFFSFLFDFSGKADASPK